MILSGNVPPARSTSSRRAGAIFAETTAMETNIHTGFRVACTKIFAVCAFVFRPFVFFFGRAALSKTARHPC